MATSVSLFSIHEFFVLTHSVGIKYKQGVKSEFNRLLLFYRFDERTEKRLWSCPSPILVQCCGKIVNYIEPKGFAGIGGGGYFGAGAELSYSRSAWCEGDAKCEVKKLNLLLLKVKTPREIDLPAVQRILQPVDEEKAPWKYPSSKCSKLPM